MPNYCFSVSLNVPMDEAIDTLKKTLMDHHLGIVSDVGVSDIVKNKLNEDMNPYRILGACNPKMAKTMIDEVADIGSLLPCTITAREVAGVTTFDFMDPEIVLGLAENNVVNQVAQEAKAKLLSVKKALEQG